MGAFIIANKVCWIVHVLTHVLNILRICKTNIYINNMKEIKKRNIGAYFTLFSMGTYSMSKSKCLGL